MTKKEFTEYYLHQLLSGIAESNQFIGDLISEEEEDYVFSFKISKLIVDFEYQKQTKR